MKWNMRAVHPRVVVFIFALSLFLIWGRSFALAEDADHVCNMGGHKIWFVAIGKDVFAFPYDQYFDSLGAGPLVDNIDPKLALIPPNPKAPLGCSGNPQQLQMFSVLNRPEIESPDYSGSMPQSIGLLEMYRYPNSNVTNPSIDPVIESKIDSGISCQKKKFVYRWDNGTILCANTNGQLNPLLNNKDDYISASWEFIVSGKLYITPLGQNLVEDEFANQVNVFYLLRPSVYLHYSWLPPKSASVIDPSYLINLDKLFLSKVRSYEVNNYQWPK